jgi:GNAT superfamily N-acetyltransferase
MEGMPIAGIAPPPAYPDELVGVVKTTKGVELRLRRILPADATALVEFHGRLSPQSVYRRFFSVHPTLSEAEVRRFTNVDYVDRLALVVCDGDRLVAIGRYDRRPGTAEAEVAFVVAEEYRHQGLATVLLETLADAALRRGITTFSAQTLAENREMLAVFADSGFRPTCQLDEGVVAVRFSIEPDDVSRAARAARHGGGHPGGREG